MYKFTTNSVSGAALAVVCMLTACQQTPTLDRRVYPDAVVTLSQVDPAYRPYFAAQNGANYSREEMMAAFQKAKQTAAGPMPSYAEPAKPKPKPKTTIKPKTVIKGKTTTKGKTTVTKGKTTVTKGKTVTKPKTTVKPKTTAKPKTATKKTVTKKKR